MPEGPRRHRRFVSPQPKLFRARAGLQRAVARVALGVLHVARGPPCATVDPKQRGRIMRIREILAVLALVGCQVVMADVMTPVAHEYSPSADQCLEDAKTNSAVKFCLGVEQAFQENRLPQ